VIVPTADAGTESPAESGSPEVPKASFALEASRLDVALSETVEVTLRLEQVEDLFGAEVHLVYDAGKLEMVDADEGKDGVQIAAGDLLKVGFEAQHRVEGGRVDYGVAQMPPTRSVSGSGPLVVLTVRGIEAGEAEIRVLSILLANSKGEEIPVDGDGRLVLIVR
jgi:hypothetical protein